MKLEEKIERDTAAKDFEAWVERNRLSDLRRQRDEFHRVLTKLAQWENGDIVNGRFDEPHSAAEARKALAQFFIGPCPHGRDPWDRCDEECETVPVEVVMARRIAMDVKP